jgi:hypothetical protein
MPFIDGLGDRVGKGEVVRDTRVVSVTADASQTLVTMRGMVSVEDATGQFANPGNAAAADGINYIDPSAGADNQVGVTLVDTTTNSLDVEVVAEGY